MGVLWKNELTDKAAWQAVPIGELAEQGGGHAKAIFHLWQFGQGNEALVALFARLDQTVYVNGELLIGQLRILRHQDEILAGPWRYYYSAESRPCISAFRLAEGGRQPKCGVCRGVIEDGQAVVVCPRCGRAFHQIPAEENFPAKECWTYRDKCLCEHPTDLGEGATWRPEQEEFCV